MAIDLELEKTQESSGTELKCPACRWTYFIERRSAAADFVEERYAERVFRQHDCRVPRIASSLS